MPPPIWRQIQKNNFVRLKPLIEFLHLSRSQADTLWDLPRFPLNLPIRLANKIIKGTLDDPILRQFIPQKKEQEESLEESVDPVGDKTACQSAKLLKKYQGRALLLTTSACAMHCRYCFRQDFPYEHTVPGFEIELRQLQENSSIQELILSGGDPLSLSNESLAALFSALESIPHLRKIRFHTRFPIGIPERIDDAFLKVLSNSSKTIFFVIHVNHPRELDADILAALKKIQFLGIPLLCQSVLLKGVNDNIAILTELYEQLTQAQMIPYYLHLLDRVKGSAHFDVPEESAQYLLSILQATLPGYAVPKLVREIAGQPSKTMLAQPLILVDQPKR